MAREPVFYSFHFDNDVHRVQLMRNMGVIEGNEPVNPNEWEQVRKRGDAAIKKWIDDNMAYRRCVVVLIGTETANRPYVKYEIERAWSLNKGLFGIHIHNLKCMRTGTCGKGTNPFQQYNVRGTPMVNLVRVYDPNPNDAYNDINRNMANWVATAIAEARTRT